MSPDSLPARASAMIFANDSYVAEFFPAATASRRIVISFAELGDRNLDGTGFAGRFLLDSGFDVIAVKSARDRWYHDAPGDMFVAIGDFLADRSAQYDWRAAYGASMGGYAAIISARRLGVDVVLAISPQFDITADWDLRWAVFRFGPFMQLESDMVGRRCRYVMLYDPFDDDRLHIEAFGKIIPPDQLTRLKLPCAGHPPTETLDQAGVLAEVAGQILDGGVAGIDRRAIVSAIHGTPRYAYFLASRCLERNHARWAETMIGRALEKLPLESETNMKAAQIADRCGDRVGAIRRAAIAVAVEPENPTMNFLLATYLRRENFRGAALRYMDAALALLPGDAGITAARDEVLREMG